MTQEEKAKAYDEMTRLLSDWYKNETDIGIKDHISAIYPEIAESADEKIRKRLIEEMRRFQEEAAKESCDADFEFAKKAITWLEKQGEQVPTEKIEPKFKVGDWVVWDNKIFCHIDNIYQGKWSLMYTITDTNNMTRSYSVKGFDNNTHLWTIEDAKEGDVLAAHECYVIFKEIDGLNIKYHYAYHFMNNPSFYVNTWQNKNAFHPATKEQRDLLFQKMEEAGYMWDYEKKELKKIEQMSALKEENEYRIKDIIYFLDTAKKHYASTVELDACINWLKSLRPHSTWKPSDEQMQALSDAGNSFRPFEEGHKILWSLYYDLKKLREE